MLLGLDHHIINVLPEDYLCVLTDIYNELFAEGIFPPQWLDSLVVFIPKSHGSGVKSFSLLSCFFKVLEKAIYFRLKWFIESRDLLPPFQMDFLLRKCASLKCFVYANLISYKICAFLDIKGDFHNVCPNILINDLTNLGILARTRKFIFNLLVKRHSYFVINDILKGPFTSRKGTPQGEFFT